MIRSVTVIAIAVLVGCGGQTAEEQARSDWESHAGDAWQAYEAGFRNGWEEGCYAAEQNVEDEHPARASLSFCGNAPSGPNELEAAMLAPSTPPDDPEGEGHSDGLVAGCEHVYFEVREEPGDLCVSGWLFG
jgi:hypothetical protein